jgi:hypothetical protein
MTEGSANRRRAAPLEWLELGSSHDYKSQGRSGVGDNGPVHNAEQAGEHYRWLAGSASLGHRASTGASVGSLGFGGGVTGCGRRIRSTKRSRAR